VSSYLEASPIKKPRPASKGPPRTSESFPAKVENLRRSLLAPPESSVCAAKRAHFTLKQLATQLKGDPNSGRVLKRSQVQTHLLETSPSRSQTSLESGSPQENKKEETASPQQLKLSTCSSQVSMHSRGSSSVSLNRSLTEHFERGECRKEVPAALYLAKQGSFMGIKENLLSLAKDLIPEEPGEG